MIKLIATDMDGTLLNEHGKLPEAFFETLEKLKEGYKLEVLYNQHVKVASGNESESDFFKLLDISASKDIYRSTSYKEVTDVSLVNKESFVSDISYSNKNGKLVESRLTVENVIEDKQVVDSEGTAYCQSWLLCHLHTACPSACRSNASA